MKTGDQNFEKRRAYTGIFVGIFSMLLAVFGLSCKQNGSEKYDNTEDTHCCCVFKNDSLCIDSVSIMFYPHWVNFPCCTDCGYIHEISLSNYGKIVECAALDSVSKYISALQPLPKDTVCVESQIHCRIFYHNGKESVLELGLVRGTCLNGVKMHDNMAFQRFIKTKIRFYDYFTQEDKKLFRELNDN